MTCGGCQVTDHERTGALMCYTCVHGRAGHFTVCTLSGLPIHAKTCEGKDRTAAVRACPRGLTPDRKGLVKWLGVTWIGVPFPRRLLLRRPLRWWWGVGPLTAPPEGCGCVRRLKTAARLLRRYITTRL